MGAGLALQVRKLYPQVYRSYIDAGDRSCWKPRFLLGTSDIVKITDELLIANAFIQEEFGPGDKKYVSYDAINDCFAGIKHLALETGLPVKYPRIGAGLAGGNWDIISTIISANLPLEIEQTLFVM